MNLLVVIVTLLLLRLSDEDSNLVEGSLDLGDGLQVRVQIHDVEDDLPAVKQVGGDFSACKLAILNSLGRNKGRSNEGTVEEELEAEHHRGVVICHILANIEHSIVGCVKLFDSNILSTEGLDSSHIAEGLVGDGGGLSFHLLVLLLSELCQPLPDGHHNEDWNEERD